MTQYTKIPYTLVLSLLLTLFAGPLKFSLSKADGLVRELWTGEMEQTAPLPWKGRMELYIRYASDEENKHFTGVLSWPDLGSENNRNGENYRF